MITYTTLTDVAPILEMISYRCDEALDEAVMD